MAIIKHLFHIDASFEQVFEAISTVKGLSSWWTEQTSGGEDIGDEVEFRFDSNGFIKCRIEEKEQPTYLVWECLDGHPEWHGTIMTFSLSENDGKVRVKFEHNGWKEESDFYGQCNFSWGRYFVSLRNYCETGVGDPYRSVKESV